MREQCALHQLPSVLQVSLKQAARTAEQGKSKAARSSGQFQSAAAAALQPPQAQQEWGGGTRDAEEHPSTKPGHSHQQQHVQPQAQHTQPAQHRHEMHDHSSSARQECVPAQDASMPAEGGFKPSGGIGVAAVVESNSDVGFGPARIPLQVLSNDDYTSHLLTGAAVHALQLQVCSYMMPTAHYNTVTCMQLHVVQLHV